MDFEWDDDKDATNVAKHGIDFAHAQSVFLDPNAFTVFDPDHSADEDRYLTIGFADDGRLLVVSHTDRGDATRIISARKATKREAEGYPDEYR
ncbi:MAG: BrnT family toxin [Pirellulales bacterium]|nr:BrnT family toxin [Pirellulales bacterium]